MLYIVVSLIYFLKCASHHYALLQALIVRYPMIPDFFIGLIYLIIGIAVVSF